MKQVGTILLALFLVGSLLAGAMGSPGCGRQSQDQATQRPTATPTQDPGTTPGDVPTEQPVSVLKALRGVSLSPRSNNPSDFTGFFEKARQTGNVVSWAGDWMELANSAGAPAVVAELASRYDYVPVVEAQFFTQSSGDLLRPLDAGTRRTYESAAADFAARYHPRYIGFGIEVNMLYEKSPSDFEAFVRLFNEVAGAVSAVSPATKVFTVFQLERLKGLQGGLFGGANEPANAQWSLLDRFPEADLFAFTTYPGLIYKDPSEIPVDYYREIALHAAKPIAFTEIGWHSASSPRGWESTDAEQAEFVRTFFNLTEDLEEELAIWSFMYDPATIEPFNTMGLRRGDDTARPAWDEWVNGR